MKNPCINCITLALCKGRAYNKSDGIEKLLLCNDFRKYVITSLKPTLVANRDNLNEAGKLFNYYVKSNGIVKIGARDNV